jgi:hypothetical protein
MGTAPMDDSEFEMQASASGILRCLRSLAEEASSLHMYRTLSAIENALEAAACECGMETPDEVSQISVERLH